MSSSTVWTTGYTPGELDAAQAKYGLRFPPDLVELLLDRRPATSFDWRADDEYIRDRLALPLEGIIFDIEHNNFWLADWGERPQEEGARHEIAAAVVAAAPALIPIYSHRYLPAEPYEAGNPVFSVHQTDIIYYGANLADYFENEFGTWTSRPWSAYRRIRFWSDLVLLNSV